MPACRPGVESVASTVSMPQSVWAPTPKMPARALWAPGRYRSARTLDTASSKLPSKKPTGSSSPSAMRHSSLCAAQRGSPSQSGDQRCSKQRCSKLLEETSLQGVAMRAGMAAVFTLRGRRLSADASSQVC